MANFESVTVPMSHRSADYRLILNMLVVDHVEISSRLNIQSYLSLFNWFSIFFYILKFPIEIPNMFPHDNTNVVVVIVRCGSSMGSSEFPIS